MKTFDDAVIKLNKEAPSLHFNMTNLLMNKSELVSRQKNINQFSQICEEQLAAVNKLVILTQAMLEKGAAAKPAAKELLRRLNQLYPYLITYTQIIRQQLTAIDEGSQTEFRNSISREKNLVANSQSFDNTLLLLQGICKLYSLIAKAHYEFSPSKIPKEAGVPELLKMLEKCQFRNS